MAVLNQNALLFAGDDAILTYTLTDETGAPLNLTGVSFTYTIAAYEGGPAVVTKTSASGLVVILNAIGGIVSVDLGNADTIALSGVMWQQLVMTDASGNVSTVSTGNIIFKLRTGSVIPSTPAPPPGTAGFDYPSWSSRYPDLAAVVPPPMAQALFSEACLYVDNTPQSRIQDVPTRTLILRMTVAHLAILYGPHRDGSPASPLVGRISSATEGSVSVSAEYSAPGSAAWWAQTKPGADAWAAMAPYRTFRYAPHPVHVMQPWGYAGWR
jgi:hypothetical protein